MQRVYVMVEVRRPVFTKPGKRSCLSRTPKVYAGERCQPPRGPERIQPDHGHSAPADLASAGLGLSMPPPRT
jgi:hypothetical protein